MTCLTIIFFNFLANKKLKNDVTECTIIFRQNKNNHLKMERLNENRPIDTTKIIIKNVDDGNMNYRQDVSVYDLLLEMGIEPSEIPKYEDDILGFKHRQHLSIKGFEVEIFFHTMGKNGHLCGYVRKYTGDTDWMDKQKYSSIIGEQGELCLDEIKGLYHPYGGFTHYCGFDCAHFDDTGLFDEVMCEKLGPFMPIDRNSGSFKSSEFVKNELNKIIDSLIEHLQKDNISDD